MRGVLESGEYKAGPAVAGNMALSRRARICSGGKMLDPNPATAPEAPPSDLYQNCIKTPSFQVYRGYPLSEEQIPQVVTRTRNRSEGM
jgi:hypothetical protein